MLRLAGRVTLKGLGVHSAARLVYALDGLSPRPLAGEGQGLRAVPPATGPHPSPLPEGEGTSGSPRPLAGEGHGVRAFQRFEAEVGIDDSTGGRGSAQFRVLVDGHAALRQPDHSRRRAADADFRRIARRQAARTGCRLRRPGRCPRPCRLARCAADQVESLGPLGISPNGPFSSKSRKVRGGGASRRLLPAATCSSSGPSSLPSRPASGRFLRSSLLRRRRLLGNGFLATVILRQGFARIGSVERSDARTSTTCPRRLCSIVFAKPCKATARKLPGCLADGNAIRSSTSCLTRSA